MEVVQGKSTDKKVLIAQEIAFAKVLAGNNKTLRDRAIKKLKKWLTIRGNGKWEFTEEEFLRIWTGLFYCMWMSDKFLIQEELTESISKLIHCFKKNSSSALLFIKCFNKRILMDWDGLDQYRIDKFNMLTRRFLRQTLLYCKEKHWEESLLNNLTDIFYNVVLHRDNALGFVLHFISIFAEELAKVSQGKLNRKVVLKLVEPFIMLIAKTRDDRIRKEGEDFFMHLMKQTDAGIEFEERFNAWKEQGYPGEGPQCMMNSNGNDVPLQNGNATVDEEEEEEDDFYNEEQVLDPRAGSVHVFLPQIPIDVDGLTNLFKKYQNSKQTHIKGKKLLKLLTQKFLALKRGKFPLNIKKNPILLEKIKKNQSVKNAKKLLEFTEKLEDAPIQTREFKKIFKELEKDSETEGEDLEENKPKKKDEVIDEEGHTYLNLKNKNKTVIKNKNAKIRVKKDNPAINGEEIVSVKKKKNSQKIKSDESTNCKKDFEKRKKKLKSLKAKQEGQGAQETMSRQCIVVTPKKKVEKKLKIENARKSEEEAQEVRPMYKKKMKRKILSTWQVQELDVNSPEYYKIETPKEITIERKIVETNCMKEDGHENESREKVSENAKRGTEPQKDFIPIFWEKAKAKAVKRSGAKAKTYVNPFANSNGESETPNKRISFALDRNMAQENDQYLEEVKNSPRVPFDGSKKPVQSALKSGLAPSPVNPFYRFKKIKLHKV